MVRSLQMEEASGLACFALLCGDSPIDDRKLKKLVGSGNDDQIIPPGALALWRLYLMPDELATYRRRMVRMRQLVERPYYEAYADWQTFEDDMQGKREGILNSVIFLFVLSKEFVTVVESDALAGLTRLAVAAKLYKAKNGKYPQSMEELMPAFLPQPLLDPFDGKPLRLHSDGAGLILYSIGADRKDDGGTPWNKSTGQGDIVFRLK
jgi:hypothetical protein